MDTYTYHAHVIIPHATEPCILVTAEGALPLLTLDTRYSDAGSLLAAVETTFGLRSFLRFVHKPRTEWNGDHGTTNAVNILQNSDPAWMPSDGYWWAQRSELNGLPDDHQAALDVYFGECDGLPVPPERAAWSRAGWYDEVCAWTEAKLKAHGITLLSRIEQRRMWPLTCTMRAHTSAGDVYFKAVPPLFQREPAVTETLARIYPQHLPKVLATEPARGWVLLLDFNATMLNNLPQPDRVGVMRRYAELQVEQAAHIERWLALGAADRRLPILARQIEPFIEDAARMASAHIPAEDFAALRAAVPKLKALCAELDACEIPPSLVHGDFHGNNIAVDGERIIYFDWTDACIAHPFVDLVAFIVETRSEFGDSVELESAQRAYLSAWEGFAPLERLTEIAALAKPLALLHMAISYRDIVAMIEPELRLEMQGALAFYLRRLLRELAS